MPDTAGRDCCTRSALASSRPPARNWVPPSPTATIGPACWSWPTAAPAAARAHPGHQDPRATEFDAAIENAVRTGDLSALQALDQHLASELLATARPAWQVLAAAMPSPGVGGRILYADAPLGVYYLVACLAGVAPAPPGAVRMPEVVAGMPVATVRDPSPPRE
jgi:hypothetical protein